MKLCLKCFSLWPRDAVFCGKCRRALGKRCPKGHVNLYISPGVTCATCNEFPVDGVPYLQLTAVVQIVTIIAIVVVWRYAWHHRCQVMCTAIHVPIWILSILFDTTQRRVMEVSMHLVLWFFTLFLISYMLPQKAGQWPRRTLQSVLKFGWQVVRLTARFVWGLIKVPVSHAKSNLVRSKDGSKEVHDSSRS